MELMTEEDIIKRFYEDINKSSESWFDQLFGFPNDMATFREFFDILPEPLREYAYIENTNKMRLDTKVHVATVFNIGFCWTRLHGNAWRRLHHKILDKLRGLDVGEVTVDGLFQ